MSLFSITCAFLCFFILSCSSDSTQKNNQSAGPGYVLKKDQGSLIQSNDSSMIIKASPAQGSQNDIAIVQKVLPGKGTGLHYHKDADEIFYVMEGTGTAVVGDSTYSIETGDFIFIPQNTDHKIRKYDSTGILKVVFFMDKPGLLKFFKERHQQFYVDKKPMTLDELNKVAEKYGTHFKTLN